MKDFKQILDTLPSIEHLSGLSVLSGDTVVQYIPALEGKLGSLKVYNALAQEFNGKLDPISAQKGLELFAEHTTDAREHLGKHPNIDLLFRVIDEDICYQLVPDEK